MRWTPDLHFGLLMGVGLMLLGGCRAEQEPGRILRTFLLSEQNMVIYEVTGGAVKGASMGSGEVLWRYQPDFKLYQYIDYTPRYRLVCPIALTPAGRLILRYTDTVHAVEVGSGELSWFKEMPLTAEGVVRCPAVTPDSGLLLFRRSGLILEKRDFEGNVVWRYSLMSMGKAAAPPQVNMKTGDALLLTTTHVLSLSPRGSLNWAKKRGVPKNRRSAKAAKKP